MPDLDVQQMNIADVRKSLSEMRREWAKHSDVRPFLPSFQLANGMLMSDFALRFIMGHHAKRQQR